MKKSIIIIVSIILIVGTTILVFSFYNSRRATLIITSKPKNIILEINGKKNSSADEFNKKVSPGKYEIEASKEYYEDYKKTISVKPKEVFSLKIELEINQNIKLSIKKSVDAYMKSVMKLKKQKYKTKIGLVEKRYSEVLIRSTNMEFEQFSLILKENEDDWKVVETGDTTLGIYEKQVPKTALIKKLPYVANNFEVDYVDFEDAFYVTIIKKPEDKAKQDARNWFDEQGIDRNTITIRWTTSPVLIRK